MRNFSAAFFLLIVSLPLVLSLLFAGEQICAYLQKKSKNDFCTIQVKKSDLIWIKKNKEVAIKGKMFDVKTIKEADNFLELYGYYDEAEDKFFSFFHSLFAEDDSDEKEGQKFLSFVLFPEKFKQNNFPDFFTDTLCKNQYGLSIEPAILRRPEDIISPPPNSF